MILAKMFTGDGSAQIVSFAAVEEPRKSVGDRRKGDSELSWLQFLAKNSSDSKTNFKAWRRRTVIYERNYKPCV